MFDRKEFRLLRGRGVQALTLGLSLAALTACDSLLEADLPYLLTDEAIKGASTAETQVSSAQALFECGMSTFGWIAQGHEDIYESVAGVAGGAHVFDAIANTGLCGDADNDQSWFDQIMGTRALISTDPAKLAASGAGAAQGVYDRINRDWSLGADGERLSAVAAIYMAASLYHFGDYYCEGAIDASDLLTNSDFLALADAWITRATGHIATYGDFVMPNSAAPSAQNTAIGLRALIRAAQGNLAGAAADAQTVLTADPDFTFYVTREAGPTRRNRAFQAGQSAKFSGILGVNNWWDGAIRPPNPATGTQWPATIGFTGYIFLGIMPDGRTLEAGNLPVRWAQELRDAAEQPIPLANGAVADGRVRTSYEAIQGPKKREVPARYADDADDQPLVSWRELTLLRAWWENATNNNQANAIALVNSLRTWHNNNTGTSLPLISGAYLTTLTDGTNDQTEVRYMLFEEVRRELFGDGMARFWSWKIRNPDIAWFPRNQGQTPEGGYNLQGGVRMAFPTDEYTNNPALSAAGGLALRGTGCSTATAPVL